MTAVGKAVQMRSTSTAGPLPLGYEDRGPDLAVEHRELTSMLPRVMAEEDLALQRWQRARPWSRRRALRAWEDVAGEVAQAKERRQIVGGLLEGEGVGAGPGWTALSVLKGRGGRTRLSVEGTLTAERDCLPERRVEQLLRALPQIRVAVALDDDRQLLEELHQELLSLAEDADSEVAQHLVEHLPGELRPLPATARELNRGGGRVTLTVSQPGLEEFSFEAPPEHDAIKLWDIVVDGKGHGLGTAVLVQLCRLADRDQVAIYGRPEPGPRKPDEDLVRLARWYSRHGFTAANGTRPPDRWTRNTQMIRRPQAPAHRS